MISGKSFNSGFVFNNSISYYATNSKSLLFSASSYVLFLIKKTFSKSILNLSI